MITLGITGSIATGKSTISAMLKKKGIEVFDADHQARHELYNNDVITKQVLHHFGTIDRHALATAVFAHEDKLKLLESILHPPITEARNAFLESAKANHAEIVALDIPLLYEKDLAHLFDYVIVTYTDPQTQMKRALERPNMTGQMFNLINNRQMPQEEKKAYADFTIDTTMAIEEVERQLDTILNTIKTNHA